MDVGFIRLGDQNLRSLYMDDVATLDELREAVTTLEETESKMRRILGCAHPDVAGIKVSLRYARAALCAREDSV